MKLVYTFCNTKRVPDFKMIATIKMPYFSSCVST